MQNIQNSQFLPPLIEFRLFDHSWRILAGATLRAAFKELGVSIARGLRGDIPRHYFSRFYYRAGKELYKSRRFALAAICFQKGIENGPDRTDNYVELARTLGKAGYPARGIQILKVVSQISPRHATIRHEMGRLNLKRNNFAEAEKCFRKAIKEHRIFLPAYVELAMLLSKSARHDEMEEIIDEALSCGYSDNIENRIYILELCIIGSRPIPTDKRLALKTVQEPQLLYRLASAYRRFGRENEVGEVLNRIAELTLNSKVEDSSIRELSQAGAQLLNLGMVHAAIWVLRLGLARVPDDFELLRQTALSYMKVSENKQASEFFEKALRQRPQEYALLFEYGRNQSRLGEFTSAISLLERAAELHSSAAFYHELARVLRAAGNYSKAEEAINKAAQLKPISRAVRNQRSLIRADLKVYSGAFRPHLTASRQYRGQQNKILHVLENSLPYRAGGYTYRSSYILKAQVDLGLSPAVCTRPGFPEDHDIVNYDQRETHNGVLHYRFRGFSTPNYNKNPLDKYLQKYAEEVVRVSREFRPEILHAASNFKNGIAARAAATSLGIPMVYELRGIWEETQVSKGVITRESERYRFFRSLETRCMHEADAVVTISRTLKAEIIERGIDPDKIFIAYNAVDVEKFPVVRTALSLKQKLGLGDGPVVGYVSSLVAYEGIDLLIKSFQKVLSAQPDARLLIVGDGEEKDKLAGLVRDLQLEGKAILTGRVNHNEVLDYYSLIDVFVVPRLPYRVCEIVTPLKPYEAMSTGRAVVVSDVSALKEMIVEDKTGLSFKAGDEESLAEVVVRLCRDKELRIHLGDNAAKWVRDNRSWTHIAKEYLHAYDYSREKSLKTQPVFA